VLRLTPTKAIAVVEWHNGAIGLRQPILSVGYLVEATMDGVTLASECRNGTYRGLKTIAEAHVIRIASFDGQKPQQQPVLARDGVQ